jgi:hypothetical protein
MGLLDDAIREHLELKRRHGADPQEVARQEDEALGPIGGHEPHTDHQDDHEPEQEGVHDDQLELVDEPPAPYEAPAAVEHDEPELPHVAEEPAEAPAFDVQQPTVEFSVEDEHAPDEAPAEPDEDAEPADELEETPEFLQETPEHDRLWFEQKPPRDFDF